MSRDICLTTASTYLLVCIKELFEVRDRDAFHFSHHHQVCSISSILLNLHEFLEP